MGIGAVLARNPEARRNFALASQEEQTALIDSCTHCNSYEEMLSLIHIYHLSNELFHPTLIIRWNVSDGIAPNVWNPFCRIM